MSNRMNVDFYVRANKMIRTLICGRHLDNFGHVYLDRYPTYGGRPEDDSEMRYRILNNMLWRLNNIDTTRKLRWANGEIDNI